MHIGANTVIDDEDILMIISRETLNNSRDTRRALDNAIGSYRVQPATSGTQRAYIILEKNERMSVYSSSISPEWLSRRE